MLLLPQVCVLLLPRSFGYLTCMTNGEKNSLVVVFSSATGVTLLLLAQGVLVSIIECLTKKVGCGGIKNFMACHYAPPLAPPPPYHSSGIFPYYLLSVPLALWQHCEMETSLRGDIVPARLNRCPQFHWSLRKSQLLNSTREPLESNA